MAGLKQVMAFVVKKQFPYCAAVGWMYVANFPFIFDNDSGWVVPRTGIPWRSWKILSTSSSDIKTVIKNFIISMTILIIARATATKV